ncbi:MAG: response regulator transcription factor [Lachnospiraceae bacterium]|nr:response regulator transcription factor [Lachnospiraceae bacterium]
MLVYICEDSKEHADDLYQLLDLTAKESKLSLTLECYNNAEEVLNAIIASKSVRKRLPDIIFLDIKLPGMNGIELGKKLVEIASSIKIVFLTTYEEYAIQGYETRAYRYLLKPVNREDIALIIRDVYQMNEREQFVLIHDNEEELILPTSEIRYISAEDKYSVLHAKDGNFLDRRSLNYLEEHLENMTFFRIHRKYLVNMRYHKGIMNGKVILDNNEFLPISRRKEPSYRAHLFELLESDLFR